MSKKFAGFSPEQQFTLLKGMGYTGPVRQDMMNAFIQSSPGVAASMGRYAKMAEQRLSGKNFADGGYVEQADANLGDEGGWWRPDPNDPVTTPVSTPVTTEDRPNRADVRRDDGTRVFRGDQPTGRMANGTLNVNDVWRPQDGSGARYWDGTQWVSERRQPGLRSTSDNPMVGDTFVNESGTTVRWTGSGWVDNDTTGTGPGSEDPNNPASGWSPDNIEGLNTNQLLRRQSNLRERYSAALLNARNNPDDPAAQEELERVQTRLQAVTQAIGATTVPDTGTLTGTAITDPMTYVTTPDVAEVNTGRGQFISRDTGQQNGRVTAEASTVTGAARADMPADVTPGSYEAATVGQQQVRDILNQEMRDPITGQPTAAATVRGQMELLMQDFEGDGTPPWASGAMREAMAIMQKRGLGASSMAGQAITQAAMESALQIAKQDASVNAQFELQNLNAAQQNQIFRTQTRITTLLSDQAATNASRQFNAASENQVNTFMADLEATVNRFNAEQVNGIRMFNANQEQAISQFNAALEQERRQFNANNQLVIAQANTQWRQQVALRNNANQHEANMYAASVANGITQRAMDEIWQRERDIMNYAFTAAENEADRALTLLTGNMQIDAQRESDLWGAIGYGFRTLLEFW